VLVEDRVEADDLPSGTSLVDLAQLLADGEAYVSVQTTARPNGEVRGQIAELETSAFNARLSGNNVIPSVNTSATGSALFRYDAEAATLDYELRVVDIDGVTSAHIHDGKANETGPTIAPLFSASSPVNPTDGVLAKDLLTNDDLPGVTVERLVYLMVTGNAYVDVKTSDRPSGEIRGQVTNGFGIDYTNGGTFVADMNGEKMNPDVPTVATGKAVISFNADGTMDFALLVASLNDPESAHIHLGGPNQSGVSLLPLWDEAISNPVENGLLWEGTFEPNDADLTSLLYLLLTGDLYVDIHSEDYPDGAIRGQLNQAPGRVFMTVLTDEAVVPLDPTNPVTSDADAVALFEQSASGSTMKYTVIVDDLEEIVSIGIFQGAVGVNGDRVVNLVERDPVSDPDLPSDGVVISGTFDDGDVTPPPLTVSDVVQQMLQGNAYVQIFTETYETGELRGQIEAF
jgi:hypothetical protein